MRLKVLIIAFVMASCITLSGCNSSISSADNSSSTSLSETADLSYNVKCDDGRLWDISDTQKQKDIDSLLDNITADNNGTLVSEIPKDPTEIYLDIKNQDTITKQISIYQQNNSYTLIRYNNEEAYSYSLTSEIGEQLWNLLEKTD